MNIYSLKNIIERYWDRIQNIPAEDDSLMAVNEAVS